MKRYAFFGIILGIAGVTLDFYSSYSILAEYMTRTSNMGVMMVEYNNSALFWGAGIFSLGVAVAAFTIISVSSFGIRRMRLLGALMMFCGVLMLFVGISMYSGMTPMMQQNAYLLSSFGMFVVGILMIVNGFIMGGREMSMQGGKSML